MRDFYEILEVSQDAPLYTIKEAYKKRALVEHPDKGGDTERMALLNQAYLILSDPVERKKYEEKWKVFDESRDTQIPLGYLPTAGVAFSKLFKQLHEKFFKQYCDEPLDQNQPSAYLKAFSSDLYDGDDLFSFIKAKGNSETDLDIGVLLPEKAVEHFINFLKGDYYGNNLKNLGKAFYKKIKQLEILGQQASSEFKLFCGIYEIFLIAAKKRAPTAKMLISLHKITEYAIQNVDETINFMAPLLQSKYFRSLFSQALHCYWQSEDSNVLDELYTTAFDGQAATKSLIEILKSKLSDSQVTSTTYVIELLRYARLLLKLEQDLGKKADVPTAVFYRAKAFHLLDWMPAVMELANHAITVNTFLQIGLTLQKAAAHEENPVLRMADEKLAMCIYVAAGKFGYRAEPHVELYARLHSVKFLLSCRYNYSKFQEDLEELQRRALWIADLFPFFQGLQSNADFFTREDKNLVLMRQFLKALIGKIEDQEEIDHSYVRVFYQAYEACLNNWYQKSCDPEIENKFRRRLMQELLASKKWATNDLEYNLKAPWPLDDLDKNGWTCSKSKVLSAAKEIDAPTYKTIHGVEINNNTGEINFILDYYKDKEENYKCLLTSFDLSELFQRCLTFSEFSLELVDPDLPYHPFNQIYFKPSKLHHSQLLHTMLITDYLLKFLTVGQEVQRRDPYELRSLHEITSRLPNHLKKIIYDFHSSTHKEQAHRFWIESGEMECDDHIDSENVNRLIAVGNIRMVVKHKKQERDAKGNLVDKEGEDEGWDCYVLNQEQEQELYNGKRVIKDSALIVIKDSWELIFWENQKVTHRFTLEEDRQDLILFSELQRDSQEKVKNDDSESLRQIYQIVLKAAKKTNMPNNYSPEFIFAQEFTKYYDEFAIYFTDFGRLRELSKAVYLTYIMASIRTANQKDINLIERLLKYYKHTRGFRFEYPEPVEEFNYWTKIRQNFREILSVSITKQFKEWRSEFSAEKLKERKENELDDLRRQIGKLSFSRRSPEIESICDDYYKEIRNEYIDAYGFWSWWWYSTFTCDIYKEIINPQIPSIIVQLENTKERKVRDQLLEYFKDQLNDLSRVSANRLIDEFLERRNRPLREHLINYDQKLNAKNLKKLFPEQSIETLDHALNNDDSYTRNSSTRLIIYEEVRKAIKKHEQELNVKLVRKEKLEQSFVDLNFGDENEEVDMEGTCLWVPASFRHDIDGSRSRTVYGGVSICPKLRECVRQKEKEALLRQTKNDAKRLQQNRLAGNAVSTYFKRNVVEKYHNSSKYIVKENYYIKTSHGGRYLDVVVIDKTTGNIVKGYEAKIGNSPYTRRQRQKDEWIFDNKKILRPVKLQRFRIDSNRFYAYRMSVNPEDVPGPLLSSVTISKGSEKQPLAK